jgi:hypothetical protein
MKRGCSTCDYYVDSTCHNILASILPMLCMAPWWKRWKQMEMRVCET